MSDSTLSWRSAALRGLKPLTKLPTGNGENVRKFQICLVRTFVPDCFDEHTVLHVTFDRKGIRGSVAIEPAGDANSTAVECEGVVTEMPSADQLLLQFNVTGLRHIRDYQARESRQ